MKRVLKMTGAVLIGLAVMLGPIWLFREDLRNFTDDRERVRAIFYWTNAFVLVFCMLPVCLWGIVIAIRVREVFKAILSACCVPIILFGVIIAPENTVVFVFCLMMIVAKEVIPQLHIRKATFTGVAIAACFAYATLELPGAQPLRLGIEEYGMWLGLVALTILIIKLRPRNDSTAVVLPGN